MIAAYKRTRATIQTDNFYRLLSSYGGADFSLLNTSPRIGVRLSRCTAWTRLTAEFRKNSALRGAWLMHHGIDVNLRGDYDSTAVSSSGRTNLPAAPPRLAKQRMSRAELSNYQPQA